jgi:AcrR family transcriptional regulator
MPIQERSTITVEAITEATIQVLLSHETDRLTTTRIAERAGSQGTLYQYHPIKQSLMCALLERRHDSFSAAMEAACEALRGKPLAEMMRYVVEKFSSTRYAKGVSSPTPAMKEAPTFAGRCQMRSAIAARQPVAPGRPLIGWLNSPNNWPS